MKSNSIIRLYAGLVAVSFGVILFLHNLHFIEFSAWHEFWRGVWAVGLLVAGVLLIGRRSWLWGVVLATFGVVSGLGALHIVDVSVWRVLWPTIVIALGLAVITSAGARSSRWPRKASNQDTLALFSGSELRIKDTYKGGVFSAVFGDIDVDLRQADITDKAVIEVFTLCGGIKLIFPDSVVVKDHTMNILGGTTNKTQPNKKAKKTIYVRGECILGGIEMK